jgi:hypothetical protein
MMEVELAGCDSVVILHCFTTVSTATQMALDPNGFALMMEHARVLPMS